MRTPGRCIRTRLMYVVGTLMLSLATACLGPDIKVYERADGTTIVETSEAKATVTAVNARTRSITLKQRFHKPQTFKADESIANFDQIQVGDEVHAVFVEEFAVTLIPGGAPPEVDAEVVVALAPDGAKPAVVMAESVGVTATIIAIDGHSHKVTLEFPDGEVKTVKVSKHIDLEEIALGDSVYIKITEALALEIVKP